MEKKEENEQAEKPDFMALYNRLRSVPREALKSIGAGRLKGMSDVNPMWRIQCLTSAFGPCGFGWRYEITKQWVEAYGSEVKAFCNINLFVKVDGEWSEAIPGTGGSSAVTMERNGAYVSDECYKMALTDALSVAMKALGVAADVYFEKGKNIVDPSTKYALDEQRAKNELPAASLDTSDIFKAKEYLEKSTTTEQILWVYNTFKPLQKDQSFVDLCTARRKEIGK